MPKFTLRAWQTQILIDSEDYTVEAPTLAQAVQLLARAQQLAQDTGQWVALATGEADPRQDGAHVPGDGIVTQLDPHEVTDSEAGYVYVPEDGPERDVTELAYAEADACDCPVAGPYTMLVIDEVGPVPADAWNALAGGR